MHKGSRIGWMSRMKPYSLELYLEVEASKCISLERKVRLLGVDIGHSLHYTLPVSLLSYPQCPHAMECSFLSFSFSLSPPSLPSLSHSKHRRHSHYHPSSSSLKQFQCVLITTWTWSQGSCDTFKCSLLVWPFGFPFSLYPFLMNATSVTNGSFSPIPVSPSYILLGYPAASAIYDNNRSDFFSFFSLFLLLSFSFSFSYFSFSVASKWYYPVTRT